MANVDIVRIDAAEHDLESLLDDLRIGDQLRVEKDLGDSIGNLMADPMSGKAQALFAILILDSVEPSKKHRLNDVLNVKVDFSNVDSDE